MNEVEKLVDRLLEQGGAIVGSDSCTAQEIAVARSCGMFAHYGHYGLVLKPKGWALAAQEGIRGRMDDFFFRECLAREGVAGVASYDWNGGDPLYCGDPLTGRLNAAEARAVEAMQSA